MVIAENLLVSVKMDKKIFFDQMAVIISKIKVVEIIFIIEIIIGKIVF